MHKGRCCSLTTAVLGVNKILYMPRINDSALNNSADKRNCLRGCSLGLSRAWMRTWRSEVRDSFQISDVKVDF